MKPGIIMAVAGLVGTLLFFGAAIDFSNWDLYADNPWIFIAGGICFVVFLIGIFRVRKKMKKAGEERYRRW